MPKEDKLFVTDAECAARIGISTEEFKLILVELDRQGFPMKDPLFSNRRYWPAVRAWLDRRYGLGDKAPLFEVPDEIEPWKAARQARDGKENW